MERSGLAINTRDGQCGESEINAIRTTEKYTYTALAFPPHCMHMEKKHLILAGVIVLIVALIASIEDNGSDGNFAMFDRYGYGDDMMEESMPPMDGKAYNTSMAQGRMVEPTIAPYPSSTGGADIDDVLRDERLIIKNGSISTVVTNVRTAVDELRNFVSGIDGFVVNESFSGLERRPTANVTVRVPVDQFAATFAYIRENSLRTVNESVSGQDVTEQFVDNEARLGVLEASEQRYMEILNDAENVEEILQVEQQLTRIRQDIESLQGRQNYLERSAALSTITVYYETEIDELSVIDPTKKWSPLATFKDAIGDFIVLLQNIADFVIRSSFYLVLIGIGYLVYRFWWMRRR